MPLGVCGQDVVEAAVRVVESEVGPIDAGVQVACTAVLLRFW